MMRDHLKQAGVLEICNAGVVLTGGAARMNGFAEVCELLLECPVRIANPTTITRMPEEMEDLEYATVIGLAMYAHRTTAARMIQEHGFGAKVRSMLAKLGA
jgi:cell division protein FtsA